MKEWSPAWKYALGGALLGLGSPYGLFLLRFFQTFDRGFRDWLKIETAQMWHVYAYAGFATVFFFAAFGYVLGRWNAQLKRRSDRFETDVKYLERLSITDGLTQLYVHNYMLQRLNEEWSRARRYETPLACLFIDIDGFKAHNDAHGHLFGDRVLRRIADALKLRVRGSDLLGRFGGDEFIAILPETDSEMAFLVAERMREAVQGLSLNAAGSSVDVTVSIGIFASRSLPESPRQVLQSADFALRTAKKRGKNQTILFMDPESFESAKGKEETEYKDGLLCLSIPKAEGARPESRKVEVQ